MTQAEERGRAIQSHIWPDHALQRGSSQNVPKRQDPVTYEPIRCSVCNASAAEVLDFGIPCLNSPTRRGGAFV